MSATINEEIFSNYYKKFKFATFDVGGERLFPITSVFANDAVSENKYLAEGYKIIKNMV